MAKARRARLPDDVFLKDVMPMFESTVIDSGKPYARRHRWSRRETDGALVNMGDVLVDSLETLADYIEREDWDELVALAAQEQTRRMIRGGVR